MSFFKKMKWMCSGLILAYVGLGAVNMYRAADSEEIKDTLKLAESYLSVGARVAQDHPEFYEELTAPGSSASNAEDIARFNEIKKAYEEGSVLKGARILTDEIEDGRYSRSIDALGKEMMANHPVYFTAIAVSDEKVRGAMGVIDQLSPTQDQRNERLCCLVDRVYNPLKTCDK